MHTSEVELAGERIVLHPFGALFWPRMSWLLLSDLHLGKAAHFRKAGLPLPEGSDARTLERLDTLIAHFRPKQVVIIGDLFHSAFNNAWDVFQAWCVNSPVPIHLVPGNHDVLAERRYAEAGITVHPDRLEALPFVLEHEAPEPSSMPGPVHRICGHTHPGVLLNGQGGQRLRLPCFLVGPNVTLLPAFGMGTGLHIVRPTVAHRVFACTGKAVLDVTGAAVGAASKA